MRKTVFALLLIPALAAAGPLADKLTGTWVNDISTLEIDVAKKQFGGVSLGSEFSHSNLEILSEKANYLKITAGGNAYVIQFQGDGAIMVTRQGGIPLIYQRQ